MRAHSSVCFTGALTGGWSIPDFSPFMIPTGVRPTSYAGEAADLPPQAFQQPALDSLGLMTSASLDTPTNHRLGSGRPFSHRRGPCVPDGKR
ncbi:hypothetical protein [Streptomyces sp. S.PB5]|uniref:hypothetical protein n=1 Tax=Streptomyces sp. S.PB5 TaxID=3020844 RepID=UPI0025B279EB|nr:hypothetical protein [Streptomyces sp. S.PB5]MDN3029338.1 hypothetical protein [Streptomyces sp. S.PB5]